MFNNWLIQKVTIFVYSKKNRTFVRIEKIKQWRNFRRKKKII